MSKIVRAERVGTSLEFEVCPLDTCATETEHEHQIHTFTATPPPTKTGYSQEQLDAMTEEELAELRGTKAYNEAKGIDFDPLVPGPAWEPGEWEAQCAAEAKLLVDHVTSASGQERRSLDHLVDA